MKLSPVLRRLLALLHGGAVVLLVLFTTGCRRDEIHAYQVPKDEPWKLPAGWQEREPGTMRAAQFAVPVKDRTDTDVSLIPIRGTMVRPETTVDIVNIWRQQMQLEPVEGGTLAKAAQKVAVGRDEGELYEMVSNEPLIDKGKQRTLVAAIKADNTLWFIKITGEDAAVAQEKPVFLAFLKSLNLDAMPSSAPATARAASTNVRQPSRETAKPKPEWTAPPGWSEAPPSQMLLAKFVVAGQPEGKAEVTVSAFPGGAGGMLANINRWRDQLKLLPVEEAALGKLLTSLDLPSGKAMLVDMTGTDAKTGQPSRIIGAIQEREGLTWFYKLMGNEQVAAREKAAFLDFLKTVKYPNG
jgi:hypothetical protein